MKSYLIVMTTTKDNVDQSTENTALPNPRRNEEDKTITGVTIKNKKVSFCQFLLVGRFPAFPKKMLQSSLKLPINRAEILRQSQILGGEFVTILEK